MWEVVATHLRFADDLLLFSRAYISSVTKLMVVFQKFSLASGLEPSVEKSCIYMAGVTGEEASSLGAGINMPTGTLPFKYLGVLLTSKKLNHTEFKPLIE